MLRNFDTELDVAGVTRMVTSTTVTEDVSVTRKMSQQRQFLGKDAKEWTWSDLRDYVVAEIERRQGPIRRDLFKEAGIFKGFLGRWGDRSVTIARMVFERYDGVWNDEPVTLYRFCKAADPWFAAIIAARITDTNVTAW